MSWKVRGDGPEVRIHKHGSFTQQNDLLEQEILLSGEQKIDPEDIDRALHFPSLFLTLCYS